MGCHTGPPFCPVMCVMWLGPLKYNTIQYKGFSDKEFQVCLASRDSDQGTKCAKAYSIFLPHNSTSNSNFSSSCSSWSGSSYCTYAVAASRGFGICFGLPSSAISWNYILFLSIIALYVRPHAQTCIHGS